MRKKIKERGEISKQFPRYDFCSSLSLSMEGGLTFLSLTTTFQPLPTPFTSPWLLMTEEARKQGCALIAVVLGDRSSSSCDPPPNLASGAQTLSVFIGPYSHVRPWLNATIKNKGPPSSLVLSSAYRRDARADNSR